MNESSSSTNVESSGLRWVVALRRRSMEMFADVFPSNFRASCADSAASLVVREPVLAASSVLIRGAAESSTKVCNLAKVLSTSLACLGSLDWMGGSSFGHFVWGVSGVNSFRFRLQRLSFGIGFENASSTIFVMVDESFWTSVSRSLASGSGSQNTVLSLSGNSCSSCSIWSPHALGEPSPVCCVSDMGLLCTSPGRFVVEMGGLWSPLGSPVTAALCVTLTERSVVKPSIRVTLFEMLCISSRISRSKEELSLQRCLFLCFCFLCR